MLVFNICLSNLESLKGVIEGAGAKQAVSLAGMSLLKFYLHAPIGNS